MCRYPRPSRLCDWSCSHRMPNGARWQCGTVSDPIRSARAPRSLPRRHTASRAKLRDCRKRTRRPARAQGARGGCDRAYCRARSRDSARTVAQRGRLCPGRRTSSRYARRGDAGDRAHASSPHRRIAVAPVPQTTTRASSESPPAYRPFAHCRLASGTRPRPVSRSAPCLPGVRGRRSGTRLTRSHDATPRRQMTIVARSPGTIGARASSHSRIRTSRPPQTAVSIGAPWQSRMGAQWTPIVAAPYPVDDPTAAGQKSRRLPSAVGRHARGERVRRSGFTARSALHSGGISRAPHDPFAGPQRRRCVVRGCERGDPSWNVARRRRADGPTTLIDPVP